MAETKAKLKLNEEILDPLGMANTGIYAEQVKGNEMDNYVFGKIYNPKDSTFMSSFGMTWSDSIYGGVGIISNTTDLLIWDRALYNGELIEQEALQEAFEPFLLPENTSSQYGFGWFIEEEVSINGIPVGKRLNHHGLWPGYESSIVRYTDEDKTIIILANQAPSAKDKLLNEIANLLFKAK